MIRCFRSSAYLLVRSAYFQDPSRPQLRLTVARAPPPIRASQNWTKSQRRIYNGFRQRGVVTVTVIIAVPHHHMANICRMCLLKLLWTTCTLYFRIRHQTIMDRRIRSEHPVCAMQRQQSIIWYSTRHAYNQIVKMNWID